MLKCKQMKVGKQLKLIIGAGIVLTLLSSASATALLQDDGTAPEPNADGTQLMMTTGEAATTLTDRLTARKEALTTRLTTSQTTRLKARCEAAQVKLTAISERVGSAAGNRVTAYQGIQTKLNDLVTSLEGQVSTADLAAALTVLDQKITSFETNATDHKQTIADLLEVDCVADPTGFKASLEAAKTEHAALKAASAEIRTYLQETVKPLLQTIRLSLAGEPN